MKKTLMFLAATIVSLSLFTGCEKEPAKVEGTAPPPSMQDEMNKMADPAAAPK